MILVIGVPVRAAAFSGNYNLNSCAFQPGLSLRSGNVCEAPVQAVRDCLGSFYSATQLECEGIQVSSPGQATMYIRKGWKARFEGTVLCVLSCCDLVTNEH